jgi:hypothetical protein
MVALKNEAMKHALARQQDRVNGQYIAIIGAFDKKAIDTFNGSVKSAIARIERMDMTPEQVRARTIKELSKLKSYMMGGAEEDHIPPWEREGRKAV